MSAWNLGPAGPDGRVAGLAVAGEIHALEVADSLVAHVIAAVVLVDAVERVEDVDAVVNAGSAADSIGVAKVVEVNVQPAAVAGGVDAGYVGDVWAFCQPWRYHHCRCCHW